MAAPQTDPGAPVGGTLFVGVDGTTSFIDGDWHELKVGVVGMLGPELRHDLAFFSRHLLLRTPRLEASSTTDLRRTRLRGHLLRSREWAR